MPLDPIHEHAQPTAGSTVTLFTGNTGQTSTGTIFATNQANLADNVSIALVPFGYIPNDSMWISYETFAYTGQAIYLQQIYLGSGDSIYVRSRNGTSSFTFTGYYTS